MMGSNLRGIARLSVFIPVLLLMLVFSAAAQPLGRHARLLVRQVMYALAVPLVGLRLEVEGKPLRKGAVLFAANHSSYLDIVVLGRLLNPTFIAKQEVAGWPVLGLLARLSGTVFVRRTKEQARADINAIRHRLEAGEPMVLFAEGTTSDGMRVLPFRSTLFQVSEEWQGKSPLRVQPVSITCTHLNRLPVGSKWRGIYSWIGDEILVPHLWQVFRTQSLTVHVHFLPPVEAAAFESRKQLTRDLERAVGDGVMHALRGKKLEEPQALVV